MTDSACSEFDTENLESVEMLNNTDVINVTLVMICDGYA